MKRVFGKIGRSLGKGGEYLGLTAAAAALVAVSGVAGQEGTLTAFLSAVGVPAEAAGLVAGLIAMPIAGGAARAVQQIIKHRDKIFDSDEPKDE